MLPYNLSSKEAKVENNYMVDMSFLLYRIYYTYIPNAHIHSLQTLHYTNSMKRRSSCFNNGADFTASWSVERYGNIPET